MGKLSITEAKNGQLQKRIEQLEERLAEFKENKLHEAAMVGIPEPMQCNSQREKPIESDGFNPHIARQPVTRSKTLYQSADWNSDPNKPLRLTNKQKQVRDGTTPFPTNLSEIVTT